MRATEHPHACFERAGGDCSQPLSESLTPRLLKRPPIIGRAAQRLRILAGPHIVGELGPSRGAKKSEQLLALVWSATRIGTRSSTSDALASSTPKRAAAAVIPVATARYCFHPRAAAEIDARGCKTSSLCPIRTSSAATMPSGSRRKAYKNAPRYNCLSSAIG